MTVNGAYVHQAIPIEALTQALWPDRDITEAASVPTIFALQNFDRLAIQLPGVASEVMHISRKHIWCDMSWSLFEERQNIDGRLGYSTDLFRHDTAERLVSVYQSLAARVALDPDARLSEILGQLHRSS